MEIPSIIEMEVVEGIMTKELVALKKKAMLEDHTNFPHFHHNKSNFCAFSLIKMFQKGIPWDTDISGGHREPNQCTAFVIQFKRDNTFK